MTGKTDLNDAMQEQAGEQAAKPSLLERLGQLFLRRPEGELLSPTSTPVSLADNVRIAWNGQPFMMTLGKIELEFHPDLGINGEEHDGAREWIIRAHAPTGRGMPKFIRIKSNMSILLGRHDDVQTNLLGYGPSVAVRHVRIDNRLGDLTIQPLDSDSRILISTIPSPVALWEMRSERLMRLTAVIGRPIAPFEDDEALDAIRDVNGIVAAEAHRETDDDGVAGGIIRFPDEMSVVIMGDVHARVDNILRVLTEGDVLRALEKNKACLVFLGDLVHSEADGELEDMTSSVLALDLFTMLKLRFPENVFYIHGNHESFSPDIAKGGIPQGLLFRKHLKKLRGKAYVNEVETLFDNLAYVIQGQGFTACHAAPVRSEVDRQTLVNIRRYPGLQRELVWNRLRQTNRPAGYGKGSIKRFRRTLGLPKQAPMIVAHTPLAKDETLWMNVGDIQGHHVVYSARTDRLAVFVASGGDVWPLEFFSDSAMALLNDRPDT